MAVHSIAACPARYMHLNGAWQVLSLEHNPEFAEQARNNLSPHGLEQWASVIDAPLVAGSDGPPGMIDPMVHYPAGPALFPRLAPSAVVFLDDVARPDEQVAVRRWRQEFPDLELGMRDCEKGCVTMRKSARPAALLHTVSPG